MKSISSSKAEEEEEEYGSALLSRGFEWLVRLREAARGGMGVRGGGVRRVRIGVVRGRDDYEGDVSALGTAGLVALVVQEYMAPFVAAYGGNVTVTPYNWCLYLRVGIPCRKFIREDPGVITRPSEKPTTSTVFSRVRAVREGAEGQGTFPDSFGGGANSTTTLLPTGNVTQEKCDAAAELLGITDWFENPYYDAAYAALSTCDAVDFYPMSSLYGSLVGSSASIATTTVLETPNCEQRRAAYSDDDDDDDDSTSTSEIVEFAVREIFCKFDGATDSCPSTLESQDVEWDFEATIATEEELYQTATSRECAHWDGPRGIRPSASYQQIEVILGDLGAKIKAMQVVYVSRGYKEVRDELGVSTEDARLGALDFTRKWGNALHGRHRGGSMKFGTYRSDDAESASAAQTFPETYLVIVAYALILGYTLFVVICSGRKIVLDAILAVAGVLRLYRVLPFLVLGLGINDLFVFTHRYLELPAALEGWVMAGQVAKDAGASVTITTAANVCVFLVAAITIRMRMIAHFSLLAACALAGVGGDRLRQPRDSRISEFAASRKLRAGAYARVVTGRARLIVACVLATAAVLASLGIPRVKLDYHVNYVFERRSSADAFWQTKLKYISSNFFKLYTGKSDFARLHPLLASEADPSRYSLMRRVMDSKKIISGGQENWYNYFADIYDRGSSDLSSPLVPACTAWPVQYFRCSGDYCFGPDELTPNLFDAVINNETTVYGIHPSYFYECLNLFLRHDDAHELTSPQFNCQELGEKKKKRKPCVAIPKANRSVWLAQGDMDFSSVRIWATNIGQGSSWLAMFDSLRPKLDDFVADTGLDAYPHGTFWVFYYQFRFIVKVILLAFGFSALCVFAIGSVFFVAAQTGAFRTRIKEASRLSLLVVLAIAVQILLFVALMGLVDLWVNCFTMATVIVSFGIAVEFVAHTAFGYLASRGDSKHRAAEALKTYAMPILDGAFTTFLGFAPIAASKYLYVVVYYFLIYAILVAVGFVSGILFFPALLAAAGRNNGPNPQHLFFDDLPKSSSPPHEDDRDPSRNKIVMNDHDESKLDARTANDDDDHDHDHDDDDDHLGGKEKKSPPMLISMS
ncbi:hypothetical protein CTAYLR_010164 [Chrysophaeum taylorii]|uniref:SSD domain-containing protein n=1 Tax=Chrysophaeum taylorii TaxID=2483200 RepID=A0AAD7XIY5_9STRA|nr:hypothetical protein CTAYLR_010164 [Chrysophaeum taylorii]